jgi:sorbitol/mannitol transport system substrate-binding protein
MLGGCSPKDSATWLVIATVNNNDMLVLKALAVEFERQNPDIRLKWVTLEENVLRQRVTTDVASGAGQFDVVTIGNFEITSWAKLGWLKPISDIPPAYDVGDLLEPVRDAVTFQGQVYGLPFYAESAMTYFRTDLFAAAGLRMPDRPTYAQIADFASKLNDPAHQTYGICLRGKPGWGENMAMVTMLVHAFGGRWFDAGWHSTIDTPEWHRAIAYYRDLLVRSGPPGATSNGFNENLVLFASGHCAMWIDSTVAAALLYGGEQEHIKGKVGYAAAPSGQAPGAPTWLWSWNLAVPSASKHGAAAFKFARWATSKEYIRAVADKQGWIAVPPGTRWSTYRSPAYRQAAPFADFVSNAILTALREDAEGGTRPYRGAQFVAIPEFQGIGTQVGQMIAATLTGQTSVDAALKQSQRATERTMRQAGYGQ